MIALQSKPGHWSAEVNNHDILFQVGGYTHGQFAFIIFVEAPARIFAGGTEVRFVHGGEFIARRLLRVKTLRSLLLLFALPLAAQTVPASSYGILCDGKTDDSAALNRAAAVSNVAIAFPPGAVCPTSGVVANSISGAHWIGKGATLKHILAAGDLVHALYVGGWSLEGFVFDAAGVPGPRLFYAESSPHVELRGNTFVDSAGPFQGLGAIHYWQSGGVISGNTVARLPGVGIYYDATGPGGLIADNDVAGSAQNGLVLFGWPMTPAGGPIEVRGNHFHDISSESGTGQNGNCVVVFNSISPVDLHDNNCERATYSAWRLNGSRGVLVHHNHASATGEVAAYAEFGAEANDFTDNDFDGVWAGISFTNLADRVLGLPNTARGNRINGATAYGIHIEGDVAAGNIITGAPWGVRVGFGGTGAGNVAEHNVCRGAGLQACVVVDSALAAGAAVSRIRSNVSSAAEVVSVALAAVGPVVLRVLPASVLVTDQSIAFAWVGALANGSTFFSADAKCSAAGVKGVFLKRVNGASLCQ